MNFMFLPLTGLTSFARVASLSISFLKTTFLQKSSSYSFHANAFSCHFCFPKLCFSEWISIQTKNFFKEWILLAVRTVLLS